MKVGVVGNPHHSAKRKNMRGAGVFYGIIII
jgi:hypothetical protein